MPDSGAASPARQPAAALSAAEFATLMAALGPFESKPRLAIAASGGADSVALAILAGDWVAAQGGRISTLIVDHGLRAESAREAAQVATWLSRYRLRPQILPWAGPRPRQGVAAAARAARYALLEDWCAQQGVLHLLVGHHREDQAETLLLRLGRGSGLDGLAAMAPIVERRQVRLLRPLLGVPRDRLRATLAARGQPWVEDPSNRDPTQARARLRAALPALGEDGLTVSRLAATTGHLGQARQTLEGQVDSLLAAAVLVHPAGFIRLKHSLVAAAPAEIALRVLSRCAATVSGSAYPPRAEGVQGLYRGLVRPAAKARTLGGCRFSPLGQEVLICREPAAIGAPLPLSPAISAHWDGRFRVRAGPRLPRGLSIAALGSQGWRRISDRTTPQMRRKLPISVRAGLPALWRGDQVVAVPHLGIAPSAGRHAGFSDLDIIFQPTKPLSSAQFAIV